MADEATRARLRELLPDTGTPPVFTDAQIDRFLTDAGDDLQQALVLGLAVLVAKASTEIDYAIGPDSEKASQVFDHFSARLDTERAILERTRIALPARPLGTTSARVAVGF